MPRIRQPFSALAPSLDALLPSASKTPLSHFTVVLLLVLLATGCTSVRNDVSAEYINHTALTKRASIQMKTGIVEKADGLRVGPDSTYWIDPTTMTPKSALTSSISAVSFRNRGIGAQRGALNGGAVLGLLLAGASISDPYLGPTGGFVLGGIVGVVPGLVIGSMIGGKERIPMNTLIEVYSDQ